MAGDAMYFSRSPIPYPKNQRQPDAACATSGSTRSHADAFWPGASPTCRSSGLAETESLEQLRFLENGIPMQRGRRLSTTRGESRHASATTEAYPRAPLLRRGPPIGMTKYIFITGGVVSSLGKGLTAASHRLALLERLGSHGVGAEARPLHQRRPGHDVAVPTRRGLRHRRRHRSRPRSRSLRALHPRGPSTSTPTTPPARSTAR